MSEVFEPMNAMKSSVDNENNNCYYNNGDIETARNATSGEAAETLLNFENNKELTSCSNNNNNTNSSNSCDDRSCNIINNNNKNNSHNDGEAADDDSSPLGGTSTSVTSQRFSFFSTPPRKGLFLDLIDALLQLSEINSTTTTTNNNNNNNNTSIDNNNNNNNIDDINKDSDECENNNNNNYYCTSSSPIPLSTDTSPQSEDNNIQRFFNTELVDRLCVEVRAVLESEETLLNIHIKQNETLVVVGDIHGQLSDLLSHVLSEQSNKKLNENENEINDRKFLFLGDLVDRGPCGVEVVMLLFALKVEYPQLIYIMRGNHEEPQTSRIYGFFTEVNMKFGCDTAWVKFNEVFCYLPLAAIVNTPNKRFFATHGGLSPQLTESVSIITTIERSDYGSVLDNILSEIVDGLLWSDPTDSVPHYTRNVRGCGYMFGPVASHEFCEINQFDFICRAHQVVADGYAWMHDKKVLTLFSVPNYCGINNNLGAIMIIRPYGTEEELQFKQFTSAVESKIIVPSSPKPCGEFIFSSFLE